MGRKTKVRVDKAKIKKKRGAKVILTNLFMAISVVTIVAVLTLVAMGYTLTKDGGLEQSGLVRLESSPNGALVEIDEKVVSARTPTNQMLRAGTHKVLVSRAGYDTWEKEVEVEAGLMTRLNYIRLFPIVKHVEEVHEYEGLSVISFAGRSKMLTISEAGWEVTEGFDDKVKVTKVDTAELLEGEIEVIEWSRGEGQVIVRIGGRFVVVDALFGGVFDVDTEFGLQFSEVRFIGEGGERLVAIENGNLRHIDIKAETLSAVVADGVEEMVVNDGRVFYMRAGTLYARREGDSKATKLYKLAEEGVVPVGVGSYLGDEWVSYAQGERFYVYRGGDKVVESDLGFEVSAITGSPSGRFVVASGGDRVAVADLEMQEWYGYEVEGGGGARWIDNYLIYSDVGGKLVVRDFDGGNRREVGEVTEGRGAIISNNGKYLYFFNGEVLSREVLK